jgi:hypothetical protein
VKIPKVLTKSIHIANEFTCPIITIGLFSLFQNSPNTALWWSFIAIGIAITIIDFSIYEEEIDK